ncbi:MAG: vWA domain-containing protein [Verrucomicrobiota bacterium]|nr:vWA domain-containing protein [Verrucomicrobiota bacterium]
MTFATPAVLILLALPVLLFVWEWRRRGTVITLPFDHANARRGRWLENTVRTANFLSPMLLAIAIILLAGPQRPLSQGSQRVMTNIELVLDVSGSMTATFGDGRRADKAVEALQEFVSHRKGDAFGVTLFGTEVLHWVPLTQDLDALKHSAPFMKPEAMPPYMGGTRIGLALRSVNKILADRPQGDKMIILLSDGSSSDLRGQGDKISSDLNSQNIVLYYIHVANSQPQQEVYDIASRTGGEAFVAGDPSALQAVFEKIDSMQPAKFKPETPIPADNFKPFALAGISMVILQLLCLFGIRFTPW